MFRSSLGVRAIAEGSSSGVSHALHLYFKLASKACVYLVYISIWKGCAWYYEAVETLQY